MRVSCIAFVYTRRIAHSISLSISYSIFSSSSHSSICSFIFISHYFYVYKFIQRTKCVLVLFIRNVSSLSFALKRSVSSSTYIFELVVHTEKIYLETSASLFAGMCYGWLQVQAMYLNEVRASFIWYFTNWWRYSKLKYWKREERKKKKTVRFCIVSI